MRSLSSNQYVIRQGKLVLKQKNSNPAILTQSKRQEISSNFRYIPYEHTVRKVLMQDYYDNTISQQKQEIQDIKDKYQRLLEESRNGKMEIPRDKICRIQQALADNSSSQIRVLRAADIAFPVHRSISYMEENQDSRIYDKQKSFVSELVFSRQVVDDRADLIPNMKSRSVIFRTEQDLGEDPQENSNSLISCKASKKEKRERITNQTQESDYTIKTGKELIDIEEDQIAIENYDRPQHRKTASIILQHNPENNEWQECESDGHEEGNQENDSPLTQRQEIQSIVQSEMPENHSESRIAFQELLSKAIEEHEHLKQLFELYKESSEDRVIEMETNFQEEMQEIEHKYQQEKGNSSKFSKKVKKLKNEIKGKDDVILDLIQKLRSCMKENEKIKSEYRNKAAMEILELMKQKQFTEMVQAQRDGNRQNVVLAAVTLLTQCKKQREIKLNLRVND